MSPQTPIFHELSGKVRVLHVDESQAVADRVKTQLENETDRIIVETETNRPAALDRLETDSIDCIISNYDLPETNGIEFLRAVREKNAHLPFILYTDRGSEEIASDAISAGVSDYIEKKEVLIYHTILSKRILNAVSNDRAERQLTEHLEQMTDAFYAFDTNWRFTYVNDQACRVLNRDRKELLGSVVWEAFPDVVDSKLETKYREAMETQTQQTFEYDYPPLETVFDVHAHPSETTLSVYFRDITGRIEHEQELERIRDFFTEAERLGDLGAWEFDDTRDLTLTDGTKRIHGIDSTFEPTLPEAIELFHPEDQEKIRQAVEAALEKGEAYDLEARLGTADDERRWARTRGSPVETDDDRNVVRGYIQDITDQKAHEQALQGAKSQLENALEAGTVGTWQWSISEDKLVVGPAFAKTFGVDPAAARNGLPLEAFTSSIHEQDRDRVLQAIDRTIKTCSEYEQEYRVWNADGELRWVLARGHVDCDEHGNAITFSGALTDITGRKKAEHELERHQAFLEGSSDIVAVLDMDGRIEYTSPAVERILGYSPEEFAGKNMFDLVHPEESPEFREGFETLLKDPDDASSVEARFETASGEWHWLEAHGTNWFNDPLIEGVVLNIRQITERKEYEKRLKEKNNRLEEFTHVVSHDLRNPLNVATTRLELLQDECESDHLDHIEHAHGRMEALIENLFTLAQEGDSSLDVTTVELHELVEQSWQTVETKDATLTVDIHQSIRADESRLQQLFENLARNAVEHGGEDVTVTVGELDAGFYVEDDGSGIAPANRDAVFENGYSTGENGIGFGLSIIKQVVNAHGWSVDVTDGTDGGARFEITDVDFAGWATK